MPDKSPSASDLAVWFATDDLEEAEMYVAHLAKGDIEAVIRPGSSGAHPKCYEVWLRKSDWGKAQLRMKVFENLHPEFREVQAAFLDPAWRFIVLGYVLVMTGAVLSSHSALLGPCLIIAGLAVFVGHRGLPRFGQYRLIDLLALVMFLPAAVGLTIAHYPVTWTLQPMAILTGLICGTAIVWMSTVGSMNRIYRHGTGERLAVWVLVCLALAVGWFIVLAKAYEP